MGQVKEEQLGALGSSSPVLGTEHSPREGLSASRSHSLWRDLGSCPCVEEPLCCPVWGYVPSASQMLLPDGLLLHPFWGHMAYVLTGFILSSKDHSSYRIWRPLFSANMISFWSFLLGEQVFSGASNQPGLHAGCPQFHKQLCFLIRDLVFRWGVNEGQPCSEPATTESSDTSQATSKGLSHSWVIL